MTTVSRLLRSAWLPTTARSPGPSRARCGRSRRPSDSSIAARVWRKITAAKPVPSTIAGSSMWRRLSIGSAVSATKPEAGRIPSPIEKIRISIRPSQKCGTDRPTSAGRAAEVVRDRPPPDGGEHPERQPDRDRDERGSGTRARASPGGGRRSCSRRSGRCASTCRGRPARRCPIHLTYWTGTGLSRSYLARTASSAFCAAVLARERERGIARQRAHAAEHEHARDDQDDQRGAGAAQEVAASSQVPPSPPTPANATRGRPSGRTSTPVTSLREPVNSLSW